MLKILVAILSFSFKAIILQASRIFLFEVTNYLALLLQVSCANTGGFTYVRMANLSLCKRFLFSVSKLCLSEKLFVTQRRRAMVVKIFQILRDKITRLTAINCIVLYWKICRLDTYPVTTISNQHGTKHRSLS